MGSARPTTAWPRPTAQGTGTSNIRLSQCWPLAFTQRLGDDVSNNTRFAHKVHYSIAHRKPLFYRLIRRSSKIKLRLVMLQCRSSCAGSLILLCSGSSDFSELFLLIVLYSFYVQS